MEWKEKRWRKEKIEKRIEYQLITFAFFFFFYMSLTTRYDIIKLPIY